MNKLAYLEGYLEKGASQLPTEKQKLDQYMNKRETTQKLVDFIKQRMGGQAQDGTGPHGRGMGPGKGKADGSGLI